MSPPIAEICPSCPPAQSHLNIDTWAVTYCRQSSSAGADFIAKSTVFSFPFNYAPLDSIFLLENLQLSA